MAAAAKTFRLFVSSTFGDLRLERNALARHVFPRLRELCARHGARFQPIDLRWGISPEASVEQRVLQICLEEVDRCRRLAPPPNFMVLLGDRYGWQPLPTAIDGDEFLSLLDALPAADRARLASWYRRDDNAVPPAYQLEARRSVGDWADEERALRAILAAAARHAGRPLRFDFPSATELEIRRALFDDPRPPRHVFAFLRTIADHPRDRSAAAYCDLLPGGGRDTEAEVLLADLRRRLRDHLPGGVVEYQARWLAPGPSDDHIGRLPDDLDEALSLLEGGRVGPTLCGDVWRRLAPAVLDQLAHEQQDDPDRRETRFHAEFGDQRRAHFTGRAGTLPAITAYLHGPDERPLVLHGAPGSGKSTVLAEVASAEGAARPAAQVVVRFLGASPGSVDATALLGGINRQVAHAYGAEPGPEASDLRAASEEFHRCLALASTGAPLVVVLDGLDQVSSSDGGRRLLWLPARLPPHVKFLLSTTPGSSLDVLRRKQPTPALLELEAMSEDEGGQLLDRWLAEAGRCLQPAQRRRVLDAFAAHGLPLYLSLAFEEARRWRSDTPEADMTLAGDVAGVVTDNLLPRLSRAENHGDVLVGRALGYLAASRHGLAEDELVDVLSRDEAVWRAFTARSHPDHTPPERRLPAVVWARLRSELAPYLTEREADGASVLAYYHRELATIVGQATSAEGRHGDLSAYFGSQPSERPGPAGPMANRRVLAELPYHQRQSDWRQLDGTLADFWFVQAKVGAGLVDDLLADYERVEATVAEPEYDHDADRRLRERLRRFSRACNLQLPALRASPRTAAQQLYNQLVIEADDKGALHERLGAFVLAGYPDGRPWLRRCNPGGGTDPSPQLWRTLAAHDGPVAAVSVSSSGRLIASGGADGAVKVWDVLRGVELAGFLAHDDGVAALDWRRDLPDDPVLASAGRDGMVKVWDWAGEACLAALDSRVGRLRDLIFVGAQGALVVCGDNGGVERLDPDPAASWLARVHLDRVFSLSVDAAGRTLVTTSEDETVRIWDADRGTSRSLRGHADAVLAGSISDDGATAVSGAADGGVRLWDLARGTSRTVGEGHLGGVRSAGFTCARGPGLRAGESRSGTSEVVAVTGGDDATVRSWSAGTGLAGVVRRGHEGPVSALHSGSGLGWFASGGADGTVRIWDESGDDRDATAKPAHSGAVTCLAVTPGGLFASGGADGQVVLWDEGGASPRRLVAHEGPVSAVIPVDGAPHSLLTAGADGAVKLWNITAGTVEKVLVATGDQPEGLPDDRFVPHALTAVPLIGLATFDGHVVGVGRDRRIRCWELAGGREAFTFDGLAGTAETLAVDPGRRLLAVGGSSPAVTVCDLSTARRLRPLVGHTAGVASVQFTVTGHLVTAGRDGTVRRWDTGTGSGTVVHHHPTWATCVALGRTSEVVASGDRFGGVAVSGRTRRPAAGPDVLHHGAVRALHVDEDRGLVLSFGTDRRVVVQRLDDGAPVAEALVGSPIVATAVFDTTIAVGSAWGGVALFELVPR